MNIHDMTEQAYKNGYEKGINTLADKIKKNLDISICGYSREEVEDDVINTIDRVVVEELKSSM